MKARKLIWLVSLAVLAGLVSLTVQHRPPGRVRLGMIADGGAPVPPPPPLPPGPSVSGINA